MDRGEKAESEPVLPVVIVSCRAFLCEVMDVTFKPSTAHTAFPCFLPFHPCANQPPSQIWSTGASNRGLLLVHGDGVVVDVSSGSRSGERWMNLVIVLRSSEQENVLRGGSST